MPNAIYVHCAAHNLNLILNDSVKNVLEIRNFFDFVEQIYVYFSQCINRWGILENICSKPRSKTLKRLNPTRWSSRHDTLLSLRYRYVDVQKALTNIILTSNKKTEVDEAKSLRTTLETYETIFLIVLESRILGLSDVVSKVLQDKKQNLQKASELFKKLLESITNLRNQFEEIKNETDNLSIEWGITTQFSSKRIRRPKIHFDETNNHHVVETNEDFFRINVFYKSLDIIISQINRRTTG